MLPLGHVLPAGQTVRLRSAGSEDEFGAILELFEKEARALAALQHPYIVGVHQFFRDNNTAYMAMDFVDGKTLLDIIENDPDRLSPEDVNKLLHPDPRGAELHPRARHPASRHLARQHPDRRRQPAGADRFRRRPRKRHARQPRAVEGADRQGRLFPAGVLPRRVRSRSIPATSTRWPPPSTTWSAARRRRRRIRAWRPRRGKRLTRWNPSAPPTGYDPHFIDAINHVSAFFPKIAFKAPRLGGT
jgi:hypothetical protein